MDRTPSERGVGRGPDKGNRRGKKIEMGNLNRKRPVSWESRAKKDWGSALREIGRSPTEDKVVVTMSGPAREDRLRKKGTTTLIQKNRPCCSADREGAK